MPKNEFRGKTLASETRNLIFNVIQFALREKSAQSPLIEFRKAMERVTAMTGLSRETLSKIKKEGATNSGVWKKKERKRVKHPKTIILNDYDKSLIRNKIHEFYSVRKEAPTLRKLQRILKEEINFTGCIETLRKILMGMGLKYKKCPSKRKVLVDPANADITDIAGWANNVNITQPGSSNINCPSSSATYIHTEHQHHEMMGQPQFMTLT